MACRLVLAALVALAPICISADDTYEPCPEYPPLAAASTVAADAGVKSALARVDVMLANIAAKLPSGLVATVVYDQETIFSKGYGRRNASDVKSAPPTEQNLVRIASITKVFTDTLLYRLRDEGVVTLDDAVAKHVRDFRMQRAPGSRTRGTVTLRSLASHTSGLPREVPYPCSFAGTCNESTVLEHLAKTLPAMPPNRRFHYSNLGTALLGRALGHAGAAKGVVKEGAGAYEALVSKKILAPLGMKDAGFVFDNATRQKMAVGTGVDGSPIDFAAVCGPGKVAWEAPCGCLWASAADMASFMKLLFRDEQPADSEEQILDGDTVHEMLMASVLLRDGSSAVGTPWEMKYSSGMWMKSKQGELPGYRSSVTIVEPLKLGIFVSALVTDVDELSVWTIPALDILVPALKSALWHLAPQPSLPSGYSAYLGRYYDGSVRVEVEGSALVLKLGTDPALNMTASGSKNVLRTRPANLSAGCRWLDDGPDQELVTFSMNVSTGRAHSLTFMGGEYSRLGQAGSGNEQYV